MTRRALSPAARGVLLAVSAALRARVIGEHCNLCDDRGETTCMCCDGAGAFSGTGVPCGGSGLRLVTRGRAGAFTGVGGTGGDATALSGTGGDAGDAGAFGRRVRGEWTPSHRVQEFPCTNV